MWQNIVGASWANIWASISALCSFATAIVAVWVVLRWRKQDELKAKMSLKMAVAEYSNTIDQLPIELKSAQDRMEHRTRLSDLRHQLNAIKNAQLVCEHILDSHPRVIKACRQLPTFHKEYVRGESDYGKARYACKLILAEKFVFN